MMVEAPEDLLKPIEVGKSASVRVGQQCLAIGNPFGFDHTLIVGVISGLNQDISSQTGVTIGGGIQTDAAINPGNSGGPLLDSIGNMIGINTAIFTQVVLAGLNVEIAPALVASQLNVRNGVLVLQVAGNSLAAKACLLPTTRGLTGNVVLGDVIVAIDGKPVRNKGRLFKVLDDYNIGNKVLLKIQRGSEILEVP